jgi:tetratricopeptide (TPR) repeat protein
MKKIILVVVLMMALLAGAAFAEEKATDPNQLFYKANALYEAREYAKAIEVYLAVLDTGIESGNLYYNVGNSFFKLGKVGYAILCYDRAKRLMPRDSDLKSNLDYARSFVDEPGYDAPSRNIILRTIRLPFRALNFSALTMLVALLYLITAALAALSILNRILGRKIRYATWFFAAIFLLSLSAFGMRYRYEVILKHGIVIQRDVECKYEPIDKSTTYYKLGEGTEVTILKTRNGWRQIRRSDGKIAWVLKAAVEPI